MSFTTTDENHNDPLADLYREILKGVGEDPQFHAAASIAAPCWACAERRLRSPNLSRGEIGNVAS